MRVVTFNVLHGMSLADGLVEPSRLSTDLASLEADVLGLQEVDRAQPRSAHVDAAAVAAGAMGAGAAFRFVPTVMGTPGGSWRPARDGDEKLTADPAYGVALATRLPVRSWDVIRLAAAPTRAPVAIARSRTRLALIRDEPRVAVVAVLDGPGGPMTVATTHLSFVPGWNVWQLRRVCRELRRHPAPRILLGDLNIPGALAGVASGWRLLARAPTYPSRDPTVQLDHVLGDGDLPAVRASQTRRMAVSDHRALLVDLAP